MVLPSPVVWMRPVEFCCLILVLVCCGRAVNAALQAGLRRSIFVLASRSLEAHSDFLARSVHVCLGPSVRREGSRGCLATVPTRAAYPRAFMWRSRSGTTHR